MNLSISYRKNAPVQPEQREIETFDDGQAIKGISLREATLFMAWLLFRSAVWPARWHLLLIGGVALYCALPVLVNGWTKPPPTDADNLASLGFPLKSPSGYYGHYPAWLIGYTWYYYLTPLFTLGGLYVCLRRYGLGAVALGWAVIWLGTGVLIYDMQRATFVSLIGIYGIGLPLLRIATAWNPGVLLLAVALPLFHAYAGMIWGAGIGVYGVMSRRPFYLYVMAGMGLGLLLSMLWLNSSIWRVRFIPELASTRTLSNGMTFVGHINLLFTCPGCRPPFIQYFGPAALGVMALSLYTMGMVWWRGWRPRIDPALAVMGWTLAPLGVMTFTPLALDADRTAKVLAALLLIMAVVGLASAVKHLHNRTASIGIYGLASLAVAFGASYTIPLWLNCGR